jgi:hypothetical protein
VDAVPVRERGWADSLVSEPQTWRVYLRAEPGWWNYSPDWHRKWPVMSVTAEDDLGRMYLSEFGGSLRGGRSIST